MSIAFVRRSWLLLLVLMLLGCQSRESVESDWRRQQFEQLQLARDQLESDRRAVREVSGEPIVHPIAERQSMLIVAAILLLCCCTPVVLVSLLAWLSRSVSDDSDIADYLIGEIRDEDLGQSPAELPDHSLRRRLLPRRSTHDPPTRP